MPHIPGDLQRSVLAPLLARSGRVAAVESPEDLTFFTATIRNALEQGLPALQVMHGHLMMRRLEEKSGELSS